MDDKYKDWVNMWYTNFQHSYNLMHRKDPRLDNKSPIAYWNECFYRWNGYPEANPNRKRWQSNVVKPVTRQKCVAIAANVLQYYISPEIVARKNTGVNVKVIAMALSDLLEIANERDNYVRKYLSLIIDAVVYGIAYVQDDYAIERRIVKDVESGVVTNDDGTISYKEKEIIEFEGTRSRVLSPFEVFVGDSNVLDIQDQPYIFTREIMRVENAKREFGFNKRWGDVVPGAAFFLQGDNGAQFYRPMTLNDMTESEVEVLRVQCKSRDEIAVFVQGVPMTEPEHPMPYNHKKYNIATVRYEIIDNKCFWGKSLTDRLRHEQEVIDKLYRAILDKTFLNLFPPILAKGGEMVNSDIIVPGKVTPIDSEAEYIVPQGIATGVGNELGVLSLIETSMDGSSIDRSQMGQLASGERSATQINAAAQGTERILGLFANMVGFLVEDWARLRIQNIIQFWARKERYLMTSEGKKTFTGIFERDGVAMGGEIGSRIVEFRPTEQFPDAMAIREEEEKLSFLSGKKVRKIYIDPKVIRDYNIDIYVRANQNERMTPLLERAMQMEFYNIFKDDPDIDQKALKQETILAWKKDPSKIMAREQAQPEQPQMEQGGNQMSQQPGNLGSQVSAMAQPRLRDLIQQG